MNVFMFKHLSRFVIAIASFLETVLWKFIYKDVIVPTLPWNLISSKETKLLLNVILNHVSKLKKMKEVFQDDFVRRMQKIEGR